MFDYHMHSFVSYDGHATAHEMLAAAEEAGLKEICFTDHLDYDPLNPDNVMTFSTEAYNEAYDALAHPTIKIRRGFEFGMLPDNAETLQNDLKRRHFDFVIGSVHFVQGYDIYLPAYWEHVTVDQAELQSLQQTLDCVKQHCDFDVLGHLTYISKLGRNPSKRPVEYARYREIIDEILRILVQKGKGLEVNTSGMDRAGVFLPTAEYLRRFRELGGEIVTVGSDAHNAQRVGQYCKEASQMIADIFGYVCTFADRKPIFHKL
jgi:histidinol-phosphatase (PHP family)